MIDKNKIAKAARQISEKVVDAEGFDDSKPTHNITRWLYIDDLFPKGGGEQ